MIEAFARQLGVPRSSRWMLFVDGEGFTIRGQCLAEQVYKARIKSGAFFERNVFLWIEGVHPRDVGIVTFGLDSPPIRSYYYTSAQGDADKLDGIRDRLWNLGFSPEVFKKERQEESAKGVDVTLTKDMLSHAHNNNYDIAILVAGDGDFVPLVEEIRRMGKIVCVAFMEESKGLSPKLKRASDFFIRFDDIVRNSMFTYPQIDAVEHDLRSWLGELETKVQRTGQRLNTWQDELAARIGLEIPSNMRLLTTHELPRPTNPQTAALLEDTGYLTSETAAISTPSGPIIRVDKDIGFRLHSSIYQRVRQCRLAGFWEDTRTVLIESLRYGHDEAPTIKSAWLAGEALNEQKNRGEW